MQFYKAQIAQDVKETIVRDIYKEGLKKAIESFLALNFEKELVIVDNSPINGLENFCKKAKEVGVDGLIIPDLPFDLYLRDYKSLFSKYNLIIIFPFSHNLFI